MSLLHDATKAAQRQRANSAASAPLPGKVAGGFMPVAKPGVSARRFKPLLVVQVVAIVAIGAWYGPRMIKPWLAKKSAGLETARLAAAASAAASDSIVRHSAPDTATHVAQSSAPPVDRASVAQAERPPQRTANVQKAPSVPVDPPHVAARSTGTPVSTSPANARPPESKPKPIATGRSVGAAPPPAPQPAAAAADRIVVVALPPAASTPTRPPSFPPTTANIVVGPPRPTFNQTFTDGVAAFKGGQYARAKQLFEALLIEDSLSVEARYNLGMSLEKLGRPHEAEAAYLMVTRLRPGFAGAWNSLGTLYGSLDRPKEAYAMLEVAMQRAPEDRAIKVALALQYEKALMVGKAAQTLQEVIAAPGPPIPEAHYNLARFHEANGERQAAIVQYERFITTSEGRNPEYEAYSRQRILTLRR
jgi:Tfp pilus assembly protein PilF